SGCSTRARRRTSFRSRPARCPITRPSPPRVASAPTTSTRTCRCRRSGTPIRSCSAPSSTGACAPTTSPTPISPSRSACSCRRRRRWRPRAPSSSTTCSSTSARSSTPSTATSAGSTSWRWIFDRAPRLRWIRNAGRKLGLLPLPVLTGRGVRRGADSSRQERPLPPTLSPLKTRGEGAHRDRSVMVHNLMLDLFPSRNAGRFGRRLKRARGARIPVTVVTGFLGAGKTTLVRRFLATPEGAGTAVVINEFGSVGIDDALVRASSDDVTLLGNGCLGCTTRSDLQNALRNLVAERAQGTLPQFKRILIETSGLADPGPILQTFATDRALGGEFHVEVVVAVVDAVGGLDTLK